MTTLVKILSREELESEFRDVHSEMIRHRMTLVRIGEAFEKSDSFCPLCEGSVLEDKFHHSETCPIVDAIYEYESWLKRQPAPRQVNK